MKKIFLAITLFSSISTIFVFADDGPAFNCFSPKLTVAEIKRYSGYDTYLDTDNKIRGTCKMVNISSVVSINPNLQDNYLLGEHEPLNTIYDEPGYSPARHSESILLTSSTTLETTSLENIEIPVSYALFDKTYFIPLLRSLFKEQNIVISEKNILPVAINLYSENELPKGVLNNYFPDNKKADYLYLDLYGNGKSPYGYHPKIDIYGVPKLVHSFKYQEYGKYIHAPKGQLDKPQYVDVEHEIGFLNNKNLGIRGESSGHWGRYKQPVVPLTSPLKSITNYWLYTKKNDKLVLQWQKSEYELDNGKVKTITKDDKNVSLSMLFDDINTVDSIASSSNVTNQVLPNETKQAEENFIIKFINLLKSWFK